MDGDLLHNMEERLFKLASLEVKQREQRVE